MIENHSVNSVQKLALIGMAAASPDFDGLAGFGRQIYRGPGRHDRPPKIPAGPIGQVILQALVDAGVQADRFFIISLSTISTEALPASLQGVHIVDRSGCVNPLWSALRLVESMLQDGKWEAAVIAEHQPETQANYAVVVAHKEIVHRRRKRIYASILGMADLPIPINHQFVNLEYRRAMTNAGVRPETIGLLISPALTGSGLNSSIERGLMSAYREAGPQTCALSGAHPGLHGLIKASWCIYWRVLPGTPEWSGMPPEESQAWDAFFVPHESRPWFSSPGQHRRAAGYHLTARDGSIAFLFLGEEKPTREYPDAVSREEGFFLFPIAASRVEDLLAQIRSLKQRAQDQPQLDSVAISCYDTYTCEQNPSQLVACLLAHSVEELLNEANFAIKGLTESYEKKQEWQTPIGSYFTPSPLGKTGSAAFVYPGAFNAYPGAGQDLFYLFPGLYDRFAELSGDVGEMLCERKLYPRSLAPLSKAELCVYEEKLVSDPLAMLISGTSLAVLYTILLRDIFKLRAECAFGYSLGEISMLFASHVWTAADEIRKALLSSELFKTRLAGPQNAVRSYWGLPFSDKTDRFESIWENQLLIAPPDKVQEAAASEPHVYLTHINTPGQVVIGGDPQGCRRVIGRLKTHTIRAPFTEAIHNPAIASEYNQMVDLFSWPIEKCPDWNLYFSAANRPVQYTQESVAALLAQGLCTCLNFPRVIQQAYQGGARIFIELGAGSSCARWIHDTLKGSPHAAFSINQKGVDDYSALLKLFARLLSHRVAFDTSAIYKTGQHVD